MISISASQLTPGDGSSDTGGRGAVGSAALSPRRATDGQLLRRFLKARDESAFEELVYRHGAMVMGVCRRILGNVHDADDAYQATFMVLVRKGRTIVPAGNVGPWLHGVAYWTAVRAKAATARRTKKERQMRPTACDADAMDPQAVAELQGVLDRELRRLPGRYRAPLVLCELEGKCRREAAAALRVPEGTLSSRLARGRELLRRRLSRGGYALSAGAVAIVLARGAAHASAGPLLVNSTVKAAGLLAAGKGLAAVTSAKVAALAQGSLKVMLLTKLKAAASVVVLAAVGTGATLTTRPAAAEDAPPAITTAAGGFPPAPIAFAAPAGPDAPAPPPEPEKEPEEEKQYLDPIDVNVPHVSTDPAVKIDYDIVYVRADRLGDDKHAEFFTDIARPVYMRPGADLMLLHPDGSEEVLVDGGDKGGVTDPMVGFDGEWVYYSFFHDLTKGGQFEPPPGGADIYKINVKTRKVVQLTTQRYEPNTGAAPAWGTDGTFRNPDKGKEYDTNFYTYGVYNMGACPLPGGKVMFTSNRYGFKPPKHSAPCLQLFVMDDSDTGPGTNLECVGPMNIGMALHPVVLKDGRVMWSSMESQGLRTGILWGLWVINPDGTGWNPILSAFRPGGGAPNAFHFQTQLSDGSIVAEEYYNQNNSGFGTYYKLPPPPPAGTYNMGPAHANDPRNPPLRIGRNDNGLPHHTRLAYSPKGIEGFTRFTHPHDGPADRSVRGDKNSPAVGKFTHPSGAPDNHLLTGYSPGPANHQYPYPPNIDGGIYLIKSGQPIDAPAQMRLIKNDPKFNEQWPRAVVSYKRIYGIDEPKKLAPLANDGKLSPHLPEGTPFGLIGSSSLYKRETFPRGRVPKGSVTAVWDGGTHDSSVQAGFGGLEMFNAPDESTLNWLNQGADAGRYDNEEIHAVRILAMEPTTDRNRGPKGSRLFHNHASERLRILGEIPVRKFGPDGKQPTDPDGNPDTSFLAKIPADTAFTFQTINKDGMVLNMAQTWHQVRPGEVRNNCGGCHAHSQEPTDFNLTAAAKPDYKLFDLTQSVPLLTTKDRDERGRQVDAGGETGIRADKAGVVNVEFKRDIQPIFNKSCVACHTAKYEQSMGHMLSLDDQAKIGIPNGPEVPNVYYRLASETDYQVKHGLRPIGRNKNWRFPNASRYVRKFQSRRSLLTWKIHGRRTDGWTNDDFPTETTPGDPNTLTWKGQKLEPTDHNQDRADLDYNGKPCPPAEAVAGTYSAPDGAKIKVEPLTDEDRRTIVRWIDLGCPIDLDPDYDPAAGKLASYGWMLDDNRPVLTLTYPKAGTNDEPMSRILLGTYDYYGGLDESTLSVVADFPVAGAKAGENLAAKLKKNEDGVWELRLDEPLAALPKGTLTVTIKDKQGNTSRIERSFTIRAETVRR